MDVDADARQGRQGHGGKADVGIDLHGMLARRKGGIVSEREAGMKNDEPDPHLLSVFKVVGLTRQRAMLTVLFPCPRL